MGLKYTKIPVDTFEKIMMNAGILCRNFDPTTGEASNQIGATKGGLTISCTPEFSDFGEDIDNCPKNMMELKKVVSYDCNVSGTFITVDTAAAKMLVGAASVEENGLIKPKMTLSVEDFNDVWIIGDYSDVNEGANAGCIAIHLLNALNTSGFSLKTTDKGKGEFAFTLTGHVSMNEQDRVPLEMMILNGATETPYIVLDRHNLTVDVNEEVTLTYEKYPSDGDVEFTSDGTSYATVNAETGVVKGIAAGSAVITASMVVEGVTYKDTCTVIVPQA